MFSIFSGESADEAWLQMVEAVRDGGIAREQSSRCGKTREVPRAAITVENPQARWVLSRFPAINPAYAFAELIWTLNGRNDSAFLTYFNSELPKFAGDGPTFYGAYGERLRRRFGLDQFARAYKALQNCPDSRQVVLQIWDAKTDLPDDSGKPLAPDIPCNLVALLKIREGRLEWTQVMRSNDIFRGIPYDFVQFTCLQEILAGWLGVEMGAYCHLSDSLHAYVETLTDIWAASPVVAELDTSDLTLPFNESEAVFQTLAQSVDRITSEEYSAADLLAGLNSSTLPLGYQDILAVLTSEGARRRHEPSAAEEAIRSCTNPLYRQLWERWRQRFIPAKKQGNSVSAHQGSDEVDPDQRNHSHSN